MKFHTTRERLLASTMICGVMVFVGASPALAQTAPAPAPGPGAPPPVASADQQVIVTGSRIPTPNLKSVSPVQVVNSTELKLQGTTNVANLLNTLPQVYANQQGNAANGASGTATVNLRDLGPQRTLVLVNGTRLPPADVAVPAPDLDTIPEALVDRVEVLTGGASATYGSDAVAGVVNFIMKQDLEGVRFDAQFGFAQHDQSDSTLQALERSGNAVVSSRNNVPPITVPGNVLDGYTKDVTLAVGVNSPDGKGNVEAYLGYRSTDAVTENTRDYSACAIFTNNGDGKHYCGGSSNLPQGKFTNVGIAGGPTFYGSPTGLTAKAAPAYNYAPFNYFQVPSERYSAGYFAHYDLDPHVQLYSSLMFSDNREFAQIAPSGLFQGVSYPVNCDNPFLVAAGGGPGGPNNLCAGAKNDETTLFIGRRTPELGNRTDDLEHIAYRVNFGFRGDIADGWSYDTYAQYSDTIYQEHYTGEVSISRAMNALQVGGTTAAPFCLGGQTGCVPLNIFQSNALTPAMANYISGSGEKEGYATEQVVSASITGDLGRYGLQSPFADQGVGVAFGGEYRREAISLSPDQEFLTGDLAGQGGQTAPVHGAYDVKEAFFEVRAPLASNQPFFYDLSLNGGYRYSDYSSVGGTNTYKVGGEWAPVPDIRFRASYNEAVRAPNTVELFSAPAFKLFGASDPCGQGVFGAPSKTGAAPVSPAGCVAQGVLTSTSAGGMLTGLGSNGLPAYKFVIPCPVGQCTNLTSGNPNLGPETSNTLSYGVVFTPTFFKGFTASIDYWDIDVLNLVGSYGAATILNTCMSQSASGNPNAGFFCSFIHRDPTTNVIFGGSTIQNAGNLATMFGNGSVSNFNTNTGYLHTTGIDFAADYRTRFSDWGMGEWGSLDFNYESTLTLKFDVEPSKKIGHFDCVGFFGPQCSGAVAGGFDGGPIPAYRHKFRVTWGTPWDNLSLSLQWRYISAVRPEFASKNPLLATGANGSVTPTDPIDNIPAFNYIDLSATWRVRDGVTFRAGVNNLIDVNPPVVDQSNLALSSPPIGNGNTFPALYDSLGRTMFIGVTVDY
ncbi:MAG TPA: TonB-dependent receptor [Caulobacteraceae bacterium]|jgi:outer membrane receptor protein involved in Fe transport|nr:TonB-dependent receptor [Caulobacteraceae bacterium]